MLQPFSKTVRYALLFSIVLLQACLKDTATRTYAVFAPVYTTKTDARSHVKNEAPVQVASPGKIFTLGNYIFLNEVDKGIHVIDNTNPANPVNKYFIPIPGNVDLAVKGGVLYADMYRDLLAIDISNPANVHVSKIVENVFPQRVYDNGFVGDSNLVITGWIKKDTTIDYNDYNYYSMADDVFVLSESGGNPSVQTAPAGTGGSTARFALMGNYLYTVTNMELNVFNITQPQNPVFSNMVQVGWRIETIYPFSNHLFIGSRTGMYIYDVADAAHPSLLSQFTHISSCDPVIASDSFAFVTLRTGNTCAGTVNQLDILNIQNIQLPTLVKSYPLNNPHGLSKSGNTLFVCDGDGGLKVFDATDVNNLQLLQTVSGINAFDIIALNNNAIVIARDGLYQYDYSNPSQLVLRSRMGL